MKINSIEVDGYGVWSGLRIERLSDGISVLYGPNEAGKSTLLQFIRSMLYGFSPRRREYLPPAHGGRPGGVLDVAGPHGRFAIARHDADPTDGAAAEEVTLTAPDGTRQGEHFIKVLLSNVDEPVFNNVFAIGLREIQELATLSDTEAAEHLYSLSAGLDRVSLVDVLRELETSRNRILDAAGKSCQVGLLLDEREKLRGEIDALDAVNRRYGHLAAEREQLHGDVARLEEEAHRQEQLARALDLAVALRERWARRAALDEELSAFGPLQIMPDEAVERLDALNARIERRKKKQSDLDRAREAARREFGELAVNERLGRQTARIEALKEQGSWIGQLEEQIAVLSGDIARGEADLAQWLDPLGLKEESGALPTFSARSLAPLRAPAAALRARREQHDEATQSVAKAQEDVRSLGVQLEAALSARGERDLTSALDRAGQLAAQLRRRAQLDERLDQLAGYQTELEERCQQLIDRQLLPAGVLVGLGGVFVLGVVLIFASLFLRTSLVGSAGWVLGILGLGGAGVAVFGKVMLERSNAKQLEGCQKQLGMLQLQVQQAKEDRDALDAQLPRGGGPLASRLQAAEAELAVLEDLTPLETQRRSAVAAAEAAERLAAEAADLWKTARRRWSEALGGAGLPATLAPKHVRRLLRDGDRIAESQRRLGRLREDLAQRRRELDAITTRIAQIAAEAGVSLTADGPVEQVRALADAAARQEAALARRDALRAQARRFRTGRAKLDEGIGRLKHRRRQLFIAAGVENEHEYRRRALDAARWRTLRDERDGLAREIEAALASRCSEDAIRKLLDNAEVASLETQRDEAAQRHVAVEMQLRQLLERQGRLNEQIDAIAADRQFAVRQLELGVVEKRIEDAVRRWQVLAATCRILDMIRATYERDRQPETLREASGYLDRLTRGRYCRVWTPLGEHTLRVDDAEGNALRVEVLSRGTREQLFLSLRLALAASYARRGVPLPLVLDDVLVNFDADRAKAAASVLRDFAAAGHQLVVFTCHEHILKLFQSLHVPVGRLPSNATSEARVVTLEQPREEAAPVEEPPKREKPARVARRKAAPPPKPRPKPKPVKRHDAGGVFDADFFESERSDSAGDDDSQDDGDESLESPGDEDDSLWDEDDQADFDDDTAAA